MRQNHTLGKTAEQLVLNHYLTNQYRYIAHNVRSYGKGKGQKSEIDIIVQKDTVLVCVEVKARSTHFIPIQYTITPKKLHTLRYGMQKFLLIHPELQHLFVRFDAAFVIDTSIEIVENIA